jgi:single-strand DNA-binding protein
MPSKNHVTVMGHLGKDPEVRQLPNGDQVCNMSIATSEKWKDKNSGEQREKTEWHRVAVFIQGLIPYIQEWGKGDLVEVEGKLETKKWTDQQGIERYSTEIMVKPYGGEVRWLRSPQGGGQQQAQQPAQQTTPQDEQLEEEIPF